MKQRYLITGVSSGIGRALAIRLISQGHQVFGVARRRTLLQQLKRELNNADKFHYYAIDLSLPDTWNKIIKRLRRLNFTPQTIIFNAAIFKKDYLNKELDYPLTKNIIETNFFSIIRGFEQIIKFVKPKSQFIFISSSSSFKGSGAEGVGYSASKAALSVAFESLYQKYKHRFDFKIVYFGPVDTHLLPTRPMFLPIPSSEQAADKIIQACNSDRVIFYFPYRLFLFLRLIKLLPDYFYFRILDVIDNLHHANQKKNLRHPHSV